MASLLLLAIVGEVFHEKGPGADEAHFALQYIEKSRKFIQTGTAHQFAESCESISIGQELPIGPAVIGHGTELIQSERLTVKPWPFLYEHEWPTMDDPRRQCNESEYRKKERKKADSHHQVNGALPWEQSRDRRLGGVDNLGHNRITLHDVLRTMKS